MLHEDTDEAGEMGIPASKGFKAVLRNWKPLPGASGSYPREFNKESNAKNDSFQTSVLTATWWARGRGGGRLPTEIVNAQRLRPGLGAAVGSKERCLGGR